MFKNPKIIILVVVILVAISIGLIIYGRRKAKKNGDDLKSVLAIIEGDVGADGSDIRSSLFGVKPATNYNPAKDIEILKKSDGMLRDDDDAIFRVLSGKTKAQFKTLDTGLLRTMGKDLQTYLSEVFKDYTDASLDGFTLTYPKFDRAMKMIQNAA